MEVISVFILALGFFGAFAQDTSNETVTCPVGYWGANCINFCGYCYTDSPTKGPYDRECDAVSGKCTDGCQGGWKGANCDQAICDDGCNGGECLAPPDTCGNCPDISHISPGCTNIKLRGLLGSLTALGVLIFSLLGCTLGSVLYKRRKSAV